MFLLKSNIWANYRQPDNQLYDPQLRIPRS
ncbi:hypothetical protein PENSOL_c003G02561 [Penicillium solitum]|uniref:Uncharacterized protein n=1 Tax=Penicillium solitum TaxID=60172 RepID=A0A1V6RJS3_9EURO|nr:uncharacterized protein PENSOL_c003G02561 [Penicillium solitum]OQE01790.1 hypothetical protein PENSOL_c003G02561 [Penicillium solitum]